MEPIAVTIFTYNRPDYAMMTLLSIAEHATYSGPLDLHIADDGSPGGQIEKLMKAAKGHFRHVTSSNARRRGYGASYNLSTQVTHVDHRFVLAVEDDWELTHDLNLGELVADLEEEQEWLRCIRLGYIGFTQELKGSFRKAGSGRKYLALDPGSPEPHVFAGHPRLETVEYERSVGAWPEGVRAGATEFEIAHRWPARCGVVWPFELGPVVFEHIGTISAGNIE